MQAQRGNVIFVVLIGIALFAALGFAVTRSFSTGDSTLKREEAELKATEIISIATAMRDTVNRMMTYPGVTENNISFAYPDADSAYGTYGSNPRFEIFNPEGGGMTYPRPPLSANDGTDFEILGNHDVNNLGSPARGDLALYLFNVDADICRVINRRLGLGESFTEPEGIDSGNVTRFAGTYNDTITDDTRITAPSLPATARGFCVAAAAGHSARSFVYILRQR
jgi:hypothetical protein